MVRRRSLHSSPNLQQLPADETPESLENRAAELQDLMSDSLDHVPDPTSITYVDYDDPFQFQVHSSDKSSHIASLSPFSWVDCGGDIYVLELLSRGFIRVEKNGAHV